MTALVPYGVSRRSYAQRVVRATTPTTPAQSAHARRRAHAILERRRARFAKTCGNGHRWTAENTYTSIRKTGKQAGQQTRRCKACLQICGGRIKRQRVTTERLKQLRVAVIAAHPDHGGSRASLEMALRDYSKAKAASLPSARKAEAA